MDVGQNCLVPSCQTLDFLPFICLGCKAAFCAAHRFPDSHGCKAPRQSRNIACICPDCCCALILEDGQETTSIALTVHRAQGCKGKAGGSSAQGNKIPCATCGVSELWAVLCPGCGRNFCLAHRHMADHMCNAPSEAVAQKEERKAAIRAFVNEKLGNAANVARNQDSDSITCKDMSKQSLNESASKKPKVNPTIALMKLKLNAQGDSHVHAPDRVFLSVIVAPIDKTLSLFYHKRTLIGKLVDLVADISKIPNQNNVISTDSRLALFDANTNKKLDNSKSLNELLQSKSIVQGHTFILNRLSRENLQSNDV